MGVEVVHNPLYKPRRLMDVAFEEIEREMEALRKENEKLRAQLYDSWLNKKQAAEYLGVTRQTVWRMERDAKIIFHNGRIKRTELDLVMVAEDIR